MLAHTLSCLFLDSPFLVISVGLYSSVFSIFSIQMSQPYLFYSDKCPNCKQIIETLKGLNKTGLYRFILVESLPRDQWPSYLKAVPTLFVPETKEVIVGKNIFAFIAKPTSSRNDLPVKQEARNSTVSAATDLTPWGFEGQGLGEAYSLWDAPTSFSNNEGGSLYTFLGNQQAAVSEPAPTSTNTSNKNSKSDDDFKKQMEMITKQRESEFGAPKRV